MYHSTTGNIIVMKYHAFKLELLARYVHGLFILEWLPHSFIFKYADVVLFIFKDILKSINTKTFKHEGYLMTVVNNG